MKCFYHNDMDGKCAGFWVDLSVGLHDLTHENSMIAIDYKDRFPIESIRKDEQIYIVDFSIEPVVMRQLLAITKDVTWIDHHKTAIEKYQDFELPIRGIRKDGIAGCVLTYLYIHHLTARGDGEIKPLDEKMFAEVPRFTKLIGDRDVWAWKYGDTTKHFHDGMQIYDTDPKADIWVKVMDDNYLDKVVEQGRTVERFKKIQRKEYLESYSYEAEFEGYRAIVCNTPDRTSEFFDSKPGYDLMMVYVFDGKQYTVSLYSTKIDVSEIAKKYGGGGHKGAAGFPCKTLPF